MLHLEELVIEFRLCVVHAVEGVGVIHLHHAVDRPIHHLLALDDEDGIIHRQAHPGELPRSVFDTGFGEAGMVELPDNGFQIVVLVDEADYSFLLLLLFLFAVVCRVV